MTLFFHFQKSDIINAQPKKPNMQYFPQNERNLLLIELHIGKYTELKSFEKLSTNSEKSFSYKEVKFKTILLSDGPIKIEGFLKQDFAITTAN